MWPFTKKKKRYGPTPQEYRDGLLMAIDYKDYYTEDLVRWFASENDAFKLACAYCIINSWGWPNFMPKPSDKFDLNTHGYVYGSYNYGMIRFSREIMDALENKAETISPGTKQQVWLSGLYEQYDLFNQGEGSQRSVATEETPGNK